MYGQGNFPPPYHHPSQLSPPKQTQPTGLQSSNLSYLAPATHSYSFAHSTQQYTQPLKQQLPPPPPRLPFQPQQQLYHSTAALPPNFVPGQPHHFGLLSTNSTTIPVPIPSVPPLPPPPPSLPPPPMHSPPPEVVPAPMPPPPPEVAPAPMPPPPPEVAPPLMPPQPLEVAPMPSGVVLNRENLDSTHSTNLDKEKAGSVSPANSDMDMEDDDVPASSKETNQSNREIIQEPPLVNKESNVVKEVCHTSQYTIIQNVEGPLHVSQERKKELGENADVLDNACSPKPLPHAPTIRGEGFIDDISPPKSLLAPVECVIDASSNSMTSEENPNQSPFQPLQRSLDSVEDADDPASDNKTPNECKNNVKHKGKELHGSELNEAESIKRLRSKSPIESPRKRIKLPLAGHLPTQQTEMTSLFPHPLHYPAGNPGPISGQDSSQKMWSHLPPPPPPPLAPHMQHVHTLHPTSDFTTNLVAPYPPVELPQTFPLPFPSHAERWPLPSVSLPPNLSSSFPSSTNTGAAVSSSTLLPSFTGSTITTRYNPYASTFETIPPPVFSIPSNLPGQGFSTNYNTKYGTAQQSSGSLYDPLSDSIEPSKKPNPLLVPDQSSSKPVTEPDVDELGEVVGAVENVSPEPLANPGPGDTSTITGSKERNKEESRSMKLLKVALADYVKEVLKPAWRQGNISKDAFKTIVKKTVDKVSASVPSHHIPKTPSKINQYVEASQQKVTKLVMGYVDKYVKKQL